MNEHCRHPALRFIPPRWVFANAVAAAFLGMLGWMLVGSACELQRSAARAKTSSYLKQLSLALHNFEAVHGQLPPAIGGTPVAGVGVLIDNPKGPAAAFSKKFPNAYLPTPAFILPYLELDPLFRRLIVIDGSGAVPVQYHVTTAGFGERPYQQSITVFRDPADPSAGDGTATHLAVSTANWGNPLNPAPVGGPAGTISFGANFMLFGELNPSGSAVKSFDGGLTIAKIADGSSNTVAFAQKYAVCTAPAAIPNAEVNQGIPVVPAGSGGSLWAEPNLNENAPFFAYPQGGNDAYTTGPGLKFQVQPNPFARNCNPYRAATNFVGGMLVGLADGSVRSVSPSISEKTWHQAVAPHDFQKMGDDW